MIRHTILRARRARKIDAEYKVFRHKHRNCTFCTISTGDDNEIVSETKHFYIIKNRFPYEVLDGSKVTDHLLVVPKDHFLELRDMTPSERKTLVEVLAKYEKKGYSFFGRSQADTGRSMIHQHTHLIKTEDKSK
ncbi:MAG: HIT domain-containing protein [Candidatus Nomurabacteria bacterium]|jgi:diadenosine tetraphosphate (Ap4A) HIT family hydrolase|nr:HIT domain-containing protein [Candidatus Nomurabacteria bacterium]